MEQGKDIRFAEKKVDESWKEQIDRDRQRNSGAPAVSPPIQPSPSASRPQPQELPTSPEFLNLINTLIYQALFHLGEIPEAQGAEVNLEAAKEAIELLRAIQMKTAGNLSKQESAMLGAALPELQMKFAQHV